jgi:nucleoside-diphosphate-sugar epimerase
MSLNLSDKESKNSKIALLGDGLIGTGLNQYWGGSNFEYKQFSRKLTETDFMDFKALEKALLPYDIIVNTIAHTDTKDKGKNTHWNINFVLSAFLADFCANFNKRLVHISTDYVYAGSPSNADEQEVLVPFGNWYSCSKLMADNYIELKCDDYLVIRTAHKLSPFPFKNGYINVIGSFQSICNSVSQIAFLTKVGAKGVFNIGPTEPLSIYSYALQESMLPGENKPKVGKSVYSGKDIPLDTTMSCKKFYRFKDTFYDKDK